MPLKCLKDGEPYYAFRTELREWRELKLRYRVMDLRMACCGARAIPKVSVLGTRFFAHRPRQQCRSVGRESAEHLSAKSRIAESAITIGDWHVGVEVAGKTPEGDAWQADVLCSRRDIQIAFEVQLSQQPLSVYQERQEKYARAKVRACWLVRRKHFDRMHWKITSDSGLPIFGLNFDGPSGETVTVDKELRGAAAIPLEDFVNGALSGALAFIEPVPGLLDAYLDLISATCWRCHQPIRIVRGYRPRYARTYECVYLDGARYPNQLAAVVNGLRRSDNRITPIGYRFSKTVGHKYFAASCPVCTALQGRHFMFTEYGSTDVESESARLRFNSDDLPQQRWIWRPSLEVARMS